MTDAITDHETALFDAFTRVVRAERLVAELKAELQRTAAALQSRITATAKSIADAWSDVEALMADTGETEVLIPYAADLVARVHYTTPGVKCVADAEACPEEYVRVKREPKLVEIKRDFLELWKAGAAVPNWITFEPGEARLTWSPAKSRGATP